MNTLSLVTDCRNGTPKCALGKTCQTVQISGNTASNVLKSMEAGYRQVDPVPPLGPNQYDLLVIGDRPFQEEDQRGVPFQDPASGMVLEMMKNAGINLDRTYMVKLVRCKPQGKRKPTVSEYNLCRDEYLRKEIELIQPKVVLLIGAEALRAFNMQGKYGPINSIRGKVFEEQFAGWDDGPTFKVISTLNPSTFYYRQDDKLRARVQHDYIVVKQALDDQPVTEHFTPEWHLIDSAEKLEWLEQEINKTTLIGFDTESPHLRFRKCPLMTIQISWGWDQTAVIPMFKHDPNAPVEQEYHLLAAFGEENRSLIKGFVQRVFGNPLIAKAAQNFKYDENVLRWNYQVRIKGFRFDTQVMKHLMNELPPSDLAYLCDAYFHWGDYEAKRRAITGQGKKLRNTFDKVPDEILWPYGATDALGTYRLACVLAKELQDKHPNLWQFYIEESEPLIKALAKAEYHGGLMDMNVHAALGIEWEKELNTLRADMRHYLWPDFNPMSNPDVLKAFLNLGIPDVDLEDKAAASGYSTNKKKLIDLVEKGGVGAKLAEQIMTYRNRQKMVSTYLKNAENDLDTDGRLRYSWQQAGPVTGRLSCKFFHQIPKVDEERYDAGKPIMRDLFIAPENYEYVYGDFSQVELRIFAILAQDQEMLRILADPKEDLHNATAFEFLSSVWPGLTETMISKFNRTEVGKRVNFGLAYGSEGHALVKTGKWKDAKNVERNFTWDMLNKGMARWKSRFTGVGTFIDNMPDIVRGYGCTATNVFGRERHFGPLLNHHNDYERGKAERECINFFIQSVASCITNRTISAIDKMLEEFNIPEDVVCLVNTVHDSVAYEVRSDYVPWFKTAIEAISMQPWPQLFNNAFRMDVGSGPSWAKAEMAA